MKEPNYKEYSLEDLYDVLHHINGEKYPERLAEVKKEIEVKELDYRTHAELPHDAYRIEKGSPTKAILVGVIVDIFGGFFSQFVFPFIYYLIYHLATGLNKGAVESQLSNSGTSVAFTFFSIISWLFVPFIAGYLCARIAKQKIYIYAIIVGLITSLVGVLIGGTAASEYALPKSLIRNIISFLLILFGAFIYGQTFNTSLQRTVKPSQ